MTATLNRAVRYIPLLILALAWEAATRTGLISRLMMPPLTEVLVSWWDLAKGGDLAVHGIASLKRAGSGLGLAVVLGTTAGILMAWYKPVRMIVNPIVQLFYPMPKSALIPVMILWFGLGDVSKVVLIFLGCLLPIVVSSFNGARGVEQPRGSILVDSTTTRLPLRRIGAIERVAAST